MVNNDYQLAKIEMNKKKLFVCLGVPLSIIVGIAICLAFIGFVFRALHIDSSSELYIVSSLFFNSFVLVLKKIPIIVALILVLAINGIYIYFIKGKVDMIKSHLAEENEYDLLEIFTDFFAVALLTFFFVLIVMLNFYVFLTLMPKIWQM